MANEHQAIVTLESASGVPADDIVNTWEFDYPSAPSAAQHEALCQAIGEFYLTGSIPPDATAGEYVYRYIGAQVARAALGLTVRLYDVSANLTGLTIAQGGVPRGSAVHIKEFGTAGNPPAGTMLAAELACCVTLRANLTGVPEESGITRPRARKRGRKYLGPLNQAAVTTEAEVDMRVLPAAAVTFRNAVKRLQDDAALNADAQLSVWSRANGNFAPVIDVQTDDAIDIQRRRGRRATLRTTTVV